MQDYPKSSITKSALNKSSGAGLIWDNATQTWDDILGTWDSPGQLKTAVAKSSVTKSAITKSSIV